LGAGIGQAGILSVRALTRFGSINWHPPHAGWTKELRAKTQGDMEGYAT